MATRPSKKPSYKEVAAQGDATAPPTVPQSGPRQEAGYDWKRAVDAFPRPLQPAAAKLIGFGRALMPLFAVLWSTTVSFANLALRLIIWMSPVLIWAGRKYIKWYVLAPVLGTYNKVVRILRWGLWGAERIGLVPVGTNKAI
jgi:hypothetical protein